MSEVKNVPEIRFAEFTNAWEQRKLEECFKIRNEKNGDRYTREDVLAVSDTYGCVNQIEFHGRSFASEDISNYKIVRKGDIIYTKSPLQAKPYGIIKIVGNETGIISPLYVVNEAVDNIDSMYMYYLFDTPERTNNYLCPLVRKGAKNTMNISNSEWLSGEVTISPDKQEQQLIGTFFRHLDNLITLHQRKHEKLVVLKKAMLEKMFPQDGSNVPEVRFSGFTGPWEQRKVGEFYDFKNGLNKGKSFFGNGIPIVNFTDVFHKRGLHTSDLRGKVTLSSDEISNYEVRQGDIFFTRTSETIEEIGYPSVMLDTPKSTVFSGFVLRGRAINADPLTNLFKQYVFFTSAFRMEMIKKSSMTTRALTSGTAIKKMEFLFPHDKDEQDRIGAFFSNLDHLITLHQRKYESLKHIKAALLQKMFV